MQLFTQQRRTLVDLDLSTSSISEDGTAHDIPWYDMYIYIYIECVSKMGMLIFAPNIDWDGNQLFLGPASFDTIIGFLMLANSNLHYPTSPPRMIVWLSSWFVGLGHEECLIEIRRNNLVGYSHIFQKKTLHLPHEPNPLVLSYHHASKGNAKPCPCAEGATKDPMSPAEGCNACGALTWDAARNFPVDIWERSKWTARQMVASKETISEAIHRSCAIYYSITPEYHKYIIIL